MDDLLPSLLAGLTIGAILSLPVVVALVRRHQLRRDLLQRGETAEGAVGTWSKVYENPRDGPITTGGSTIDYSTPLGSQRIRSRWARLNAEPGDIVTIVYDSQRPYRAMAAEELSGSDLDRLTRSAAIAIVIAILLLTTFSWAVRLA